MKIKELFRANFHQIVLVFLAFLVMVLVSYSYVSNIVRQQMQNIGDISMDATQTSVDSSLAEAEMVFSSVVRSVQHVLTVDKSHKGLLKYLTEENAYFSQSYSPLPGFMKIYGHFGDEWFDGSGWVPPADFVPQSRPWYIGAQKNKGRIYFSEPYIDAETNGMCISFSQEIFDELGKAHGILAVDLTLSRITEHVQNRKISGNGYGVLIDDTMTFLAHRDPDMVGVKLGNAGGDYPKLMEMLAQEKQLSAIEFMDTDNADSIIFFRTIFNGWYLGIIIPRTSYYKDVYTLAATLGVIGFLLAIVLSTLLVRMWMQKVRSDEESSSKSNFLARMSHEMRTPMNAIIGMTTIARKSNDPEKKEYCLARISEASNHLLGVINDVLDMSKISAGKLELSETDFALDGLLGQVETVTNNKLEDKNKSFSISIAPEVPQALIADKQRLAQVITNLLSNANKFTSDGGHIMLRIRRLPDAEDGKCVIEFEVEDDGIGITKGQQARLFQSFEQADGRISRKYGGTGLGLAISKRIVEMMGGDIRVESEPNVRTRFIFTICALVGTATGEFDEQSKQQSGQQSVQQREIDEHKPVFAGRKILLAEDVAINREILTALLDGTGVQIESAENGVAACSMFANASETYDMIFMDIQMPEMDGYGATQCIRAMNVPKAKTIPIVAMSANVFREDIEKCRAAGMNDHVGKPLELGDVLAKMRYYLSSPL